MTEDAQLRIENQLLREEVAWLRRKLETQELRLAEASPLGHLNSVARVARERARGFDASYLRDRVQAQESQEQAIRATAAAGAQFLARRHALLFRW